MAMSAVLAAETGVLAHGGWTRVLEDPYIHHGSVGAALAALGTGAAIWLTARRRWRLGFQIAIAALVAWVGLGIDMRMS